MFDTKTSEVMFNQMYTLFVRAGLVPENVGLE